MLDEKELTLAHLPSDAPATTVASARGGPAPYPPRPKGSLFPERMVVSCPVSETGTAARRRPNSKDGWHINVRDLTTGQSGTIVLNSKSDGPLMPSYDTQTIGNSLKWGGVYDTPAAFVWEIGHTSPFTSPGSQFCWPGEAKCYSYDAEAWRDQSPPIHILSVTFEDGSHPTSWGGRLR